VMDFGIIVISKIVNPDLELTLSINDVVFAVNGVPIGHITDHKVRVCLSVVSVCFWCVFGCLVYMKLKSEVFF
jgi:hypothetical protein